MTAAPGFLWDRELGMDFEGLVCFILAASNYVGGDIVSGLLTMDLHKQEAPSMFFDIGTNGELVIGNRGWIIAGAGAADPALEGYISKYGMRAEPGAVDSVMIWDSELSITTIGDGTPVGICGSGIIDLLAEMRRNGWIDMAGNLDPAASGSIVFLPDEQEHAVVYARSADGSPLYFSQTDIRQYLDTKAAAYTMIDCLLETAASMPPSFVRSFSPERSPPTPIWNPPSPSACSRIFPGNDIRCGKTALWMVPESCS